jgi:putative oxidoreductase
MNKLEDLGKLLLRLSIGVLVMFHGVAKLRGGLEWVMGELVKVGVPGPVGYLVLVGELLAPLLMVLGLWTRPAALVVAINVAVAVLLAGRGLLLSINQYGGYALEVEVLYLVGALAVALLGAGRFSMGGARGRFN